jgi:hypothetical protein
MSYDFSPMTQELALWRSENRSLPIWWRDDDAVAPTAQLSQLCQMSTSLNLPVHLAIIPKFATSALAELCAQTPELIPLVHGWAHENHTVGQGKKAEFGSMRTSALSELSSALERMNALFGPRLCKMFVPPWNRITPDVTAALPKLGYAALSTFTPRRARMATPGLVQINTHIDPIFWRKGGGLVPTDMLIETITQTLADRRTGASDAAEPLGFLTHHLVHDPEIWSFTRACLGTLLEGGAHPATLQDTLP